MQIRRFYAPEIGPEGSQVALDEGESQHALRVLRLEAGDCLQLLDGRGAIAEAELLPPPPGANPRKVRTAICRVRSVRCMTPPAHPLVLYVAPPRGKAFDLVLREAVELGVSEIHPVLCEYGVSRPEESSDGWRSTLLAAMKQSSNPFLPTLSEPVTLSRALASRCRSGAGKNAIFGASPGAEGRALALLGGEKEGAAAAAGGENSPSDVDALSCRSIWIGPEGGFSAAEEELLISNGISPVTLATCVLRVETAVPALVGYLLGRDGNAG